MYTSFDARLVTSVGLNGVWAAVGQWYLGSGWMHNSREVVSNCGVVNCLQMMLFGQTF